MNLSDISFPVFRLGRRKPIIEEGVSFYLNSTEIDGCITYLPYIIDDKNIDEANLALRRIKIAKNGDKLFRLRRAVFFIADLLKITDGNTWFIDSNGKIFEYKKNTRVPLVFKPIKNIIPIKTGGAIIEVEGINSRFKTLYTPTIEHKVAGLLIYNGGYILYGLYDQVYDRTTRMI